MNEPPACVFAMLQPSAFFTTSVFMSGGWKDAIFAKFWIEGLLVKFGNKCDSYKIDSLFILFNTSPTL